MGLLLVILWCIKGMPCIGILQASLFLGALVASTAYLGMPGTYYFIDNKVNNDSMKDKYN